MSIWPSKGVPLRQSSSVSGTATFTKAAITFHVGRIPRAADGRISNQLAQSTNPFLPYAESGVFRSQKGSP